MWPQTYTNGHRYYREQRGSRGTGYCVDRSRSMICEIPDEQMGRIIEAIALPETWQDRILAQLHLEDEVKRVEKERKDTEQRLKRWDRCTWTTRFPLKSTSGKGGIWRTVFRP